MMQALSEFDILLQDSERPKKKTDKRKNSLGSMDLNILQIKDLSPIPIGSNMGRSISHNNMPLTVKESLSRPN